MKFDSGEKAFNDYYCDKCGEIIEKPEDGYVQFKRTIKDGLVYEDFSIVHHYLKSPL